MKRDDPQLVPKVLGLFRRGYDTMTISESLELRESIIERVLHAALAGDRIAKSMLQLQEGNGHA